MAAAKSNRHATRRLRGRRRIIVLRQLRVMTYNFLYAFHEREGDTMLFQEKRARAVESVVRACAPDILSVTDAVYCGAGRGRLIRPDYAKMFGMAHVHATGFDGDWGNCLVSRFPIRSVECLPLGGGRREVTSSAGATGAPLLGSWSRSFADDRAGLFARNESSASQSGRRSAINVILLRVDRIRRLT